MAAAAPMCDRCHHTHGEIEKCRTCGHIGRGVIFPGERDGAPPPPAFRLTRFDATTPPIEKSIGFLRLAQLMRNQVLVSELGMLKGRECRAASGRRTEIEEVDEHEGKCRHIMGLIGDAPVCYARWRVVTAAEADGTPGAPGAVVVIDRLLTLPLYRKAGYGQRVLAETLTDILQMLAQAGGAGVQRISAFVPVNTACVNAAKTLMKCGFASASTRKADPLAGISPEFHGEAGVQEFSLSPETAMAVYQAAMAAAPGGAAAAAAGGAGAARP